MLRPEPMSRVLIVSSKDQEKAIVETLFKLNVAHVVNHVESDTGPLAGVKIGRPLPEAGEASAILVRIRALERALDIEGKAPSRTFTVAEVEKNLTQALPRAEQDITAIAHARERVQQQVDALVEESRRLEPLAGLPVPVEALRGYRSLRVFMGRAAEPFEWALPSVSPDHELFTSPNGTFALFVPIEKADAVSEMLYKHGFKELEVPATGEGTADARLAQINAEKQQLEATLASSGGELEQLRARWADFLLAADEHLTINVEKAEAPLSFASTKNAFAVDAWVPASQVLQVKSAVTSVTHGIVHFEDAPAMEPDHHESALHGSHEGDAHAHTEAEQHEEPPTKYDNPGGVRPFEFFTSMFSTPRYSEIDPTMVLAFTFPLFYGFMIGDLAYGIILAALGALMLVKLGKVDGAKQLGTAFLAAGLVSAFFGGIVFHDAFGIAFSAHGEVAPGTTCAEFAHHHSETTWQCLFAGGSAEVAVAGHHWYTLSKLGDVGELLILSIIVATIHLGIGLLFGVANEYHHSKKHALAKVGWLVVLFGFFALAISATQTIADLSVAVWNGMFAPWASMTVIGGIIGAGIILLLATEGGLAALEIPSMLANLLSYTRLAGVAVAKGAMAVAFNGLFLVGMVMEPHSGIVTIIFGAILLVIAQMLVLILGILSSGIQAIRLNYVEFFTKFYKGGGKPFKPFGRERRYSVAQASAATLSTPIEGIME